MPKKKLFYTIFIACEGENTEPNYLGRICEEIDEERHLNVTVYPKPKLILDEERANEENRRSDPVGLVKEARQKLKEGFDEAWAVFDKDGHTGLTEAFELASQVVDDKKVQIAFSSIAFEHWLLLHFERNKTAFVKSENLINDCFRLEGAALLPEYSKSKKTDIYPVVREKTPTAIENAAWLRWQMNDLRDNIIYEINPYTDIDILVSRLLDITLEFTWTMYGEDTLFAGFLINASNTDNVLTIYLLNQTATTFIVNAANLHSYFFLYNSDYPLQIAETVRIDPGDSEIIQLTCESQIREEMILVFEKNNKRLMVTNTR